MPNSKSSKITHIVKNEIQQILPTSIAEKAIIYLKLGPYRYRKFDRFKFPSPSWSLSEHKKIEKGCIQILSGNGVDPEKPLTDLAVNGFDRLARLFHYQIVKVKSKRIKDAKKTIFLDELILRSLDDKSEIILYNKVVYKKKKTTTEIISMY